MRGIGEATDVVSKEMFTAISGENLNKLLGGGTIKGKSRLSLRPEGTAGVVRAVVQHDLVPQGAAPARLMYAGPIPAWTPRASSCSCASSPPSAFPWTPRAFW